MTARLLLQPPKDGALLLVDLRLTLRCTRDLLFKVQLLKHARVERALRFPAGLVLLVVLFKTLPVSVPLASAGVVHLANEILRTARHAATLLQAVLRITVLAFAQHKIVIVLLAERTKEKSDRLKRRGRHADLLD